MKIQEVKIGGDRAVKVLIMAVISMLGMQCVTAQVQTNLAAKVKHAPSINGQVEGGVWQYLGEGLNFNSGATITGSLFVPGTPGLNVNGSPNFGGTITGAGSASPSGYWITLNSGSTLGNLVTRTDAGTLTTVSTPPTSSGTRSVNINSTGESAGDFSTLKNLTLNGGGVYEVPAGTYGTFTANSGTGFRLGVANGTTAAIYNFQSLNLNGSAEIQVVGPVEIRVKNGFSANGAMGTSGHPEWLIIKISNGGFNFNSAYTMYGHVIAPNGTVTINSGCTIAGTVEADRLTVNSNGKLQWATMQGTSNQAPTANAQSVTTVEDTAVTVTLTGSDPEGSTLIYTVVSGPGHGVLSGTAPNLTYTPALNYFGADAFTFKVNDGTEDSTPATVSITVTAVNDAPLLGTIADYTVAEGTVWSITNTVTDVDSNVFTFALGTNAPAGMSINAVTGIITWTPGEVQGPSTNVVSVTVTDDGSPALSDTKSFTVTILEVNSAPVLAEIGSQTLFVGQLLTVTNSATDSDIPANLLTYSLGTNTPAGMTITNGVITWTPGTTYGNTTNVINVTVTDNGVPPLSDTKIFTVTVLATNNAPVLVGISNQVVAEGELLTVAASASDVDGDVLAYSLGVNAPAGMSINSTNGIISWTPSEAQGPSTNVVSVVVTDNGSPVLGDTKSFTITVLEVNAAPVMFPPANQVVLEGSLLVVTNSATDSDIPANTLTFSLGTNAPAGMAIDPITGILAWTPGMNQAPSTNIVTVAVIDNGVPPLGTNVSFLVTVLATNHAPVFGAMTNSVVYEFQFVQNVAVATDVDGDALTYSLGTNAPAWMSINATNGVITMIPGELDGGTTNMVTVIVTDNGTPNLSAMRTFEVRVLESNVAPVLTVMHHVVIEGHLLVATNMVTDSDIPANNFTFTIDTNAPAGLSINPANGIITWTPTEEQGPSTNNILVTVTDDGDPSFSDTKSMQIIVMEENTAPVLAVITNHAVAEMHLLLITNIVATDVDVPTNKLSFTLGAGAPEWMQIHGTNGIIFGTPAESDGPSTNLITVIVTDDGVPSLSATQTFVLTVMEVNERPVFGFIQDQTISEGQMLMVTNTATDVDLPANVLTYTLSTNSPPGMVMNSTNAVITWTPGEEYGGTVMMRVQYFVTDNGVPPETAEGGFWLNILEVNEPPVLAPIADQTIVEGLTLTITNAASDSDLPGNVLTYSLGANAPGGMGINAVNGVVTWTPSEAQGPSTNLVSVIVSDDGVPSMSATQTFTVFVLEANSAPILVAVPNQMVAEGELLSVTNVVEDADIPANAFTFSLGTNAPAGMSINAASGVITWIPSESQGPSTNMITVMVADDGTPVLWATNTLIVTVLEVNAVPLLATIPNQVVTEHELLSLMVTATDADLPANGLVYSLGAGAPAGMSINASSGDITWTPSEAQGSSTNLISVIVTDDGIPSLSATQTFTVVVLESNSAPILAAPASQSIDEGQFLVVMNQATDPDLPANALTYSLGAGVQNGMVIDAQTGVLTWTPNELQGPSTNLVEIIVTDNGVPPMSTNVFLTVTVREVNNAPILAALPVQSVMAGQLLTVTNFANDADYPANLLTFSLVTNELAGIEINATNGVVTWVPGESFAGMTNVAQVVVTDDGIPSLSATQSLFIYVPPLNTAPVITLATNFSGEAGSVMLLTAAVTDDGRPLGGYLTNHWELVSGAGQLVLSNANTLTASVIFAAAGDYVFRFTSGDGELSSSALTTVKVTPRNEAPWVTAGPNQFARLPATVTLLGYATDDGYPAGGSLTVQWTQTSGPATVNFGDTTITNATVTFPVVGDYILRLTASDSVLTNYSEVKVGVRNALTNQPPVVFAGPDIQVGLSNAVVLAGVVTDDKLPADQLLAINWEMVNGPGLVEFGDPTYADTLATFTTNGVYVLRLSAFDGEYTVSDEVAVSVYLTNLPPEVDAGPDLTLLVPDPAVLTTGGKQPRDARTELATGLFGQAHWNTKAGQPGLNYGVSRNGLSYSGKYLFATGPYENAGTNFVGGVARWDGTNWSALFDERPLDPNDPMSPPFGLATYDYRYTGASDSDGEELFLSGGFLKDVGGYGGGNLTARWNGTNWIGWSWHGQSSYVGVGDILRTKDAVYVGGSFSFQPTNAFLGGGGVTFSNLPISYGIIKWTGEHWTNLADGIRTYSDTGAPSTLTYGNVKMMVEGKNGEIYAAGSFEMPTPYGGATNIAMWNGTNWAPLGAGISGCYRFACSPTINAMAVDDDGNLYVGGDLAVAGGVSVRSIARWDGANWHALGSGPQNGVQGEVQAIVTHGRDVYVAGIDNAGGVPVNAVARWNREFWSPLGSGSTNGVFYSVTAMAVAPEGVYVGGVFSAAGGLAAECIALWEFPPEPDRFVRLNGRVTDDGLPYAGSLSHYWSKVSGPGEVIFADTNSAVTTASFTALGNYVLRLTANDTEYTVLDEMTVEVKGNLPPVVNAGNDVVARLNEVVTLDGSVTDDGLPENFVPISQWTQLNGPASVLIDNPNKAQTHVEFAVAGTYAFRLKANDSQFSRYDDVTVVISGPNQAPTASLGLARSWTRTFEPLQANGNPADDGFPNGTLTYQWAKVSGPDEVYFGNAQAENTTMTFRQGGTYVVSFTVSDSELTTRQEATVLVLDGSSRQPLAYAGCDFHATAGQAITLPGSIVSAADGQVLWSKVSGPGTVTFSDATALHPTASFSQPGSYQLRIRVTDQYGSFTDEVAVTVGSIGGEPPVIRMPVPFWTFNTTNPVPLTASITDDGQPVGGVGSWSWSKVSGPGLVTFSPANGTQFSTNVQTVATFAGAGTYILQLTASDSVETASKTVEVVVLETDVVGVSYAEENIIAADAGPDGTTTTGIPFVPQASVANEWYGFWTLVSGPGKVIYENDDLNPPIRFTMPGVYRLRLIAEGDTGIATDDVVVTVTQTGANLPPMVDSGAHQIIYLPGDTATLTAGYTDDGLPSGGTATYEWTFIYGSTSATIQNPDSLITQVIFDDLDAPGSGYWGEYYFKLRVTDGELVNESITAVVVVDPLTDWWLPENATAGPDQTVAAGTRVKLRASSDPSPDGWESYIEWQQVAGPVPAAIDDAWSETPSVLFTRAGTYQFRANILGDLVVVDTVTITVTDDGNVAPYVDAGGSQKVYLHEGTVGTLAGEVSDDGVPASGALSVLWTQIAGPTGAHIVSPTSPVTQFNAAVEGYYTFRLTATDGVLSSSAEVEVEVRAGLDFLDTPPQVDAGPDVTLAVNSVFTSDARIYDTSAYSHDWAQVSGPSTAVTQFFWNSQMEANLTEPGQYVFRLVARDDHFVVADEVVVTVAGSGGGGDGGVNQAPYAVAQVGPVFAGQQTVLRVLVANDCLPANPVISGEWTIEYGDGPVTFGNTTIAPYQGSANIWEVLTEATFAVPGGYEMYFMPADGELMGNGAWLSVTVMEVPAEPEPNTAPLTFAGVDVSGTMQVPSSLSGYAWDDGLPGASVLQAGWSQMSGPAAIYFGDSSVTNTTVTALVPGTYVLRLTATDGQKSSFDDVTVTVYEVENVEPFVFAGHNFNVTRPLAGNLQGIVVDDGLMIGYPLEVEWSKISGPGTVTFGSLTNPITTATFSASGTYVLRLTAYDGDLLAFDEVTVTVLTGSNEAPVVEAGADFATTVNTVTPLSGYATDDGLPNGFLQSSWSQISGPGTVQFTWLNGGYRARFSEEGTYVIRFTATDGVLSSYDELTATVHPPTPAPTVEITTPGDATEVTAPMTVTGTASSPLLDYYVLEYRAVSTDGGNDWSLLSSNTVSVVNGALGALDPTLSLNGIYELRLRAKDTLGRTSVTDPVSVIFDRNMKIGNFAFSFNDLTIPVAGIPITITRSYDSRNKEMGDFGVGWTMDINNIRLQKNRHLGINWEQTVEPGLFPIYGLRTSKSRVVTITFPSGKTYKFGAVPSPSGQFGIPLIYPKMKFLPFEGVQGTLTPLVEIDGELYPDDQVVYNGDYPGFGPLLSYELMLNPPVGAADNVIFNPDLFELKTKEGYSYIISETNGLRSITDLNGNTLTFTPNGILHSTGKNVVFERDATGLITNIVDAAGNAMQYQYDGEGNLVTFIDRAGDTNSFTYDGKHNLITVRDKSGTQTSANGYDDAGRLISQMDAYGFTIGHNHDLENRREYTTNRLGYVVMKEYDERGNIVKIVDPVGAVTLSTYDQNDNLIVRIDALGRKTTYGYDQLDNRIAVTNDACGCAPTLFTYNAYGMVLTMKDSSGTITNTYDSRGNMLSSSDPAVKLTTFTFDSKGKVTSRTDPKGGVTTFHYDQFGSLTNEVNPLGHEIDYEVDANGKMLSMTTYRAVPQSLQLLSFGQKNKTLVAPKGAKFGLAANEFSQRVHVRLYYDEAGRPITTIYPDESIEVIDDGKTIVNDRLVEYENPDGSKISYTYDPEGRVECTTDELGRKTCFDYDPRGLLTRTTYPNGCTSQAFYDSVGQLVMEIDRFGATNTYTYDGEGNRVTSTDTYGSTTTYTYNERKAVTSITDSLGRVTAYQFDFLNRNTNIVYPDGSSKSFTYDGRLVASETDQEGKTTYNGYDILGRLTSITNSLGEVRKFEYDEANNPIREIAPNGDIVQHAYDLLNRRTNTTFPDGTSRSVAYDSTGKKVSETDTAGATTYYAYDSRGRVVKNTDKKGGVSLFDYDAGSHLLAITNAQNEVVRYEYDNDGNKVKTLLPDGTKEENIFGGCGRLLTTIDRAGGETHFAYDLLGRVISITDPTGATKVFTYDSEGQIITEVNGNGEVMGYAYDALGRETHVFHPDGTVSVTVYDRLGRVVAKVDAAGNTTSFGYDAVGRLVSQTNAQNQVTSYAYDANGRLISETDAFNATTSYGYDALGRRTHVVMANGGSESWTYNARGQVASQTDANGNVTWFTYDTAGRLIAMTNALNQVTSYAYDILDRMVSLTDAANRTTTFGYDVLGRRTNVTFPDGATYTTTYDERGLATGETDALGNATRFGYDAAGRMVAVTNALNEVTRYSYDAVGRLVSAVDANNRTNYFSYDPMGRPISVILPDQTQANTYYDALGRRVAVMDQAGRSTWFGYDSLGRMTAVTNSLGNVTRYEYDALDRMTAQIDAGNRVTRYEYDAMGQRTKRILPDNKEDIYRYDLNGNLTNRTDFNSRTTTYAFDALNRVTSKIPDAVFAQAPVQYAYTVTGARQSMTDALGTTTYGYDLRDRLLQKAAPHGTLNYSYDLNGNLRTMQSAQANGVEVAYEYDALNRMNAVVDQHTGRTTYTFDPVGNLQGFTYPNGINHYHQYDSLDRLTNLTASTVLTNVSSYRYTLLPSGHRQSVQELSGRTVTYGYDATYRLTNETVNVPGWPGAGVVTYDYDAVGNRLQRNSNIPELPFQAFTYDANDRLHGETYDHNGNTLTSTNVWSAFSTAIPANDKYDYEDMLVDRGNGQITVVYDGDGNRVKKTVNGVSTWYLVDELNPTGYAQVVEELAVNPTNSLQLDVSRVYVWGHQLVSMDQVVGNQWVPSFYGYDGKGSVRQLYNEYGTVTDTYDYDAFGNLIAHTGSTFNNYQYTGEQFDADLGLYYLRARYHNPNSGRMWTMDSFEGFDTDPQSLHKYTFNHNDPVNRRDPSGHFSMVEMSLVSGLAPLVRMTLDNISAGVYNFSHGGAGGSELKAKSHEEALYIDSLGAGAGGLAMGRSNFYNTQRGAPFLLTFNIPWCNYPQRTGCGFELITGDNGEFAIYGCPSKDPLFENTYDPELLALVDDAFDVVSGLNDPKGFANGIGRAAVDFAKGLAPAVGTAIKGSAGWFTALWDEELAYETYGNEMAAVVDAAVAFGTISGAVYDTLAYGLSNGINPGYAESKFGHGVDVLKALAGEVIDIGTGGDPEHKRKVSTAERLGYVSGTLLSGKLFAKAVSAAVKVGSAAKAATASKALAIANQARKLTRQAKAALAAVGPKLNQCVTTIKRTAGAGVDLASRIRVRLDKTAMLSGFPKFDFNLKPMPKESQIKPIVIGEDQYGRIDIFAKQNGAETITDWLKKTGKTWTDDVNAEFIEAMKSEGREFLDIGPALNRRLLNRIDSTQGRPASKVYGSERKQLRDYNNRKQLYKRAGKFEGGVPGFDH